MQLAVAGDTRPKPTAPREQESIQARRAIFDGLITAWVKDRRAEEALSRKELANLDSLGRLFAQRHSLIDNIGHFYARSPRADVATGILALVTFLADNNEGCCTLSVPRMAKFFARDERRISDAIRRLKDA